jgi:hypothetical protein
MSETVCRGTKHIVVELILCSVSVWLSQLPVVAAQSVVLAWIPSSSTDVVGYRIYCGTASLNYCSQVTVGNTNRATISGLADGVTYYFAATSIDNAGDESAFSNETVYEVPSAAAMLTALPASDGRFSFSVSGGFRLSIRRPNLDEPDGLGFRGDQHGAVHVYRHEQRQFAVLFLPDILPSAMN